jgi:hypothetical protein
LLCTVSFCQCSQCLCHLQWIHAICVCHHRVCCVVWQLCPSVTPYQVLAFPHQASLLHALILLLHHQPLTLSLQTRVRLVAPWWQWVGGATATVSRARWVTSRCWDLALWRQWELVRR